MTDPRALRDAFGAFLTGVTVVTTRGPDGAPRGFTANSFSSVSLDPPLLLISIAKTSSNFDMFSKASGFGVNILSEDQKQISNVFARPVQDRFAGLSWDFGPHGAPVLAGVSAWFDCAMERVIEAGDHAILLGRVMAFHAGTAPGLGYYRGSYVTPAQDVAALGPEVMMAAIVEWEDKVLMVDDGHGGLTLPRAKVGREGATQTIDRLLTQLGVTAQSGMIYALYEDRTKGHQNIALRCPASDGANAQGQFVAQGDAAIGALRDPALREMMLRLGRERAMGNYGIYYGDADQGRVMSLGAQP